MTERKSHLQHALQVLSTTFQPWREISALATGVMDLCWGIPLYLAISGRAVDVRPQNVTLFFAVTGAGAYIFVRLTTFTHPGRRSLLVSALVLVMLGWWWGAGLLNPTLTWSDPLASVQRSVRSILDPGISLPIEMDVWLLVIWLWYRGHDLALNWMGAAFVQARLRLGVIMFLMVGFFNKLPYGSKPGIEMYVFIFAAMVAAGASRAHALRNDVDRRAQSIRQPWFLWIVSGAFLLVGLSAGITALGSDFLARKGAQFLYIGLLLLILLLFLLTVPLLFIAWSVSPGLFGSLRNFIAQSQLEARARDVIRSIVEAIVILLDLARGLILWLQSIRAFLTYTVVSVLLVIVLLLYRSFRARALGTRTRYKTMPEVRSTLEQPALLGSLRAAFMHGYGLLSAGWGGFLQQGWYLHALRIRRIYMRFMGLCEAIGHPRQEAQTPDEFARSLQRLFPYHREDIVLITRAYGGVRYGELPETQEEVRRVSEAWQRIRSFGKSLEQRIQAAHWVEAERESHKRGGASGGSEGPWR